ncbi:IS3 family transposase [Myxococcus fulvus]
MPRSSSSQRESSLAYWAWYNRRRRHSALGYVSPEEYERNASTRSAAA